MKHPTNFPKATQPCIDELAYFRLDWAGKFSPAISQVEEILV
jgi:hypothetical protein